MRAPVVVVCSSLLVSAAVALSADPGPPKVHVGTSACAGSSCHNATQSWQRLDGSRVAQDEYRTWQRHDRHALAYDALKSPRGARIAANLGIGAATEAEACLACHADHVPPELRGGMYSASVGVGCEACHGGAMDWIRSHPRGQSHADNVAEGLIPLDQPGARARTCVGCHVGDAERFVTHAMMGAGHPRLRFELDTFSIVQPAHFVVDADYTARGKVVAPSVTVWAVGQAVVVQRTMELLATKDGSGAFPELVFYDCHACHHPMEEPTWAARPSTGLGPGVPRLADADLLMLAVVADRVDPTVAAALRAQTRTLHDAMAHDRSGVAAAATAVAATAGELAVTLETRAFSAADLRAIADDLVALAVAGEYHDYAAAEQATMAMGALATTLHAPGDEARDARVKDALEACYAAVQGAGTYDPAAFTVAVTRVRDALAG